VIRYVVVYLIQLANGRRGYTHMVQATARRRESYTAEQAHEVRRRPGANVARYVAAGPEAVERRLRQLDGEWELDRAMEAQCALLVLRDPDRNGPRQLLRVAGC
jgi:hypothetical protein